MRKALLLILTGLICYSCSSESDGGSQRAAQFIVDKVYAHVLVRNDELCPAPCRQMDLVVTYKFEGCPGTIDVYCWSTLEDAWGGCHPEYWTEPRETGVWYTDSHTVYGEGTMEGVDAVHVFVHLAGHSWSNGGSSPRLLETSNCGEFTYDDTLIVPVERQ